MTEHPAGTRLCLYDTAQLEPVLAGMAARIAALFATRDGPVAMIGILRRGLPLAERLRQQLAGLGLPPWPLYPLRLQRYADDLSLIHAQTALTGNPDIAALDLANTRLLLVDDVLYEGHSLLRACAWLAQLGASEIRTAVLVDRAVTRQPVHADVAGLRLQAAPGDVIECNVPPYEERLCIELLRPQRHDATGGTRQMPAPPV